ncbi:MAG: hypothetical protein K8S23_07085 [Candidatus Cloacimonetes bacterium]|nr:hypothetical protein [Candidatus Cloacimonadota bacterium]
MIIILIILLFSSTSLFSVERPYLGTNSVSFGLGLMYQYTFSHQSKNFYIAYRHYGQINLIAAYITRYAYANYEKAILIGYAHRFNLKYSGFVALSTGVSKYYQVRQGEYLGDEQFEGIERSGIGIPLDLRIMQAFIPWAGISINITVNLNRDDSFGGLFINLHLGTFINPDYKG